MNTRPHPLPGLAAFSRRPQAPALAGQSYVFAAACRRIGVFGGGA